MTRESMLLESCAKKVLLSIGLTIFLPYVLHAETQSLEANDLWIGFASEHASSAISSFGHTFLCFSKSRLKPAAFDKTVMVAVQRTELKVTLGQQEASLKVSTFDSLVREYVEKQDRCVTLYRLKLTSLEVARVEQFLGDVGSSHLPYEFLSKNCTFYCIKFLNQARADLQINIGSNFYLTPRSGLNYILKRIGSDKVITIKWNSGKGQQEEAEPVSKVTDYQPLQLSGIGPMFSAGIGINDGNSFLSFSVRPGVQDLLSGESDDAASKIFLCEAHLEASRQTRMALTLLDFEVFRNPKSNSFGISKLFKVGFDERISHKEFQNGVYLKYALLGSRGTDKVFRLAAGPEIYLSSRDYFKLRGIVCTRFMVGRFLFFDSRLVLREDKQPICEMSVSFPAIGDIKLKAETRVGKEHWAAGLNLGYFFK